MCDVQSIHDRLLRSMRIRLHFTSLSQITHKYALYLIMLQASSIIKYNLCQFLFAAMHIVNLDARNHFIRFAEPNNHDC